MANKLLAVVFMLLWFWLIDSSFGSTTDYDAYSTTSTSEAIISVVVVPLVTTVGLIMVVVISIYCIWKGQRPRNAIPTSNYPNAYAPVIKINPTVQPSPNVYFNVPPVTPTPTTAPPTNVAPSSSPAPNSKDNFETNKSMRYDLTTLQAATNNFSDNNIIGQGGFGCVYKGILADGSEIAVKRLLQGSSQIDNECKAEIELLAKLQHKNLVRLLGFCLEKPEAILVYELLPNKSLDFFLFDSKKREELTWLIRFNIIKGIARGLLYLHEDSPVQIIHRDLKSPNILLDANMGAKIADFGLARICATDQTHIHTSRIAGTKGYMSPEYGFHGHYSVKSDVYAFGVLVLEIISGRRIGCGSNNDLGELSENLMSYAWRCWADKKPLKLMDPLIKESFSSDDAVKCIHLGLLCTQDDTRKRPNMSTIVHKLNSNPDIATLATPQYPIFLFNSTSGESTMSSVTQLRPGVSSGAVSSSVYSNTKPTP